jgi:hypothetical protein
MVGTHCRSSGSNIPVCAAVVQRSDFVQESAARRAGDSGFCGFLGEIRYPAIPYPFYNITNLD